MLTGSVKFQLRGADLITEKSLQSVTPSFLLLLLFLFQTVASPQTVYKCNTNSLYY